MLDAKRVYFIALDNVLRGHNRNSGTMLWKQVLPVRPFTGPLLSGDTLIVSGVAAELHGYNTADGKSAGPPFALKGAENEEMLLAAPPSSYGAGLADPRYEGWSGACGRQPGTRRRSRLRSDPGRGKPC